MSAIAIMGALYQQGLIHRVLIAAPASVVSVWDKELRDFADFDFRFAALLGTKDKRIKLLSELTSDKTGALLVAGINYESTHRDDIYEALCKFSADLIIADESQRIKNPKAAQSMAMWDFADRATYKLILSGTPVQQNGQDVFSQWRFLDTTVFGDNFYSFRNRYFLLGGFKQKQIVGMKNEAEFTKRMHSIAYRVTKQDCLDLPEETYLYRTVELSPKERKIYDELRKNSYAELASEAAVTADTVLIKLLRLQQVAGGFIRADEASIPTQIDSTPSKLNALHDIVEDYCIGEGRKLVIFARFLPELDAICAMLRDMGVRFGRIDGGVKLEARGGIVADFQSNPETMCFVAQIQTAGLGITLHAASTAVFYSFDFNLANYQQALARVHRKGQRFPVTYIHLLGERTVDERIITELKKKENLAKSLVDNWQDIFAE